MEKDIFKYRLNESVKSSMEFTKTMTTNSYVDNFRYIIRLNVPKTSVHLTEFENKRVIELINLKGRILNAEEACSELSISGKVPLWINIEIVRASSEITIIELLISRRFRGENELNKAVNQFPPFHPLVSLPPGVIKGRKFDINWREKRPKKGWLSLFRK